MSEDLINEDVKPEAVVEETPVVEEAPVVEETPVVEEAPVVVEEAAVAPETTIVAPEPVAEEVAGLAPVENGAIGSSKVAKAKKAEKPAVAVEDEDKVAIFSTRNVNWVGVGKISKGFNIVTKLQADQWLTRDHTKLVTPEEVAKGYTK